MRRECRECFPRHLFQRKPLLNNPGMHHGTCVTHVPWCMSGSLTRGGKRPMQEVVSSHGNLNRWWVNFALIVMMVQICSQCVLGIQKSYLPQINTIWLSVYTKMVGSLTYWNPLHSCLYTYVCLCVSKIVLPIYIFVLRSIVHCIEGLCKRMIFAYLYSSGPVGIVLKYAELKYTND